MNVIQAYRCLLTDVSILSGVQLHAPDTIDMEWVRIAAPALDKTILSYLENGTDCAVPEWLLPLWDRFIQTDDPCYLGYLRQVLVFGYKTEEQYTNEQLKAAFAAFVETDQSLGLHSQCFLHWRGRPGLMEDTRRLVSRVIARCKFREINPSHGPGAVYPPYDHCDRSNFTSVYPAIDALYPYFDFFAPQGANLFNILDMSASLGTLDTLDAHLIAVPKDSRGPRLICVHPREAVWIQQGLRRELEGAITASPLTGKFINFDDQSVNGALALRGSKDGTFATIDLKDASDRLSEDVVRYLLGSDYNYFACCRANRAVMLDGSSHVLNKYAPMGNATVFPLQSLIFWSIANAAIVCYDGCKSHRGVYVFGDDIIVPNEHYESVIKGLVRFGLVPNPSKCFHKGRFRESCGVDAYKGIDITPVKLKRFKDCSYNTLISLSDVAKELRCRGYEWTSAYVYSYLRRKLGSLPLSNNAQSAGIYEWVRMDLHKLWKYNYPSSMRWNVNIHQWQVRTLQQHPHMRRVERHDWYHVLDWFVGVNRRPGRVSSIKRNTGDVYYPDPHRYRYKRGWTTVLPRPFEVAVKQGWQKC